MEGGAAGVEVEDEVALSTAGPLRSRGTECHKEPGHLVCEAFAHRQPHASYGDPGYSGRVSPSGWGSSKGR